MLVKCFNGAIAVLFLLLSSLSLLVNGQWNNRSVITVSPPEFLPPKDNEDISNTSSRLYLTKAFSCLVQEDEGGLSVSCNNVPIQNISSHIPAETKTLKITNTDARFLTKPLFQQLKSLELLELTNNHHRFITSKPFIGLGRLKYLNLSSNDIAVIKNIFMHTPSLEHLDLSNNRILSIKPVANSLQNLKHFATLILNHNPGIQKILWDDFTPISGVHLRHLFLMNTTIQRIDRTSFEVLKYIESIDLSVNYIGNEALLNLTSGLSSTPARNLSLRLLLRISEFPFESLKPLENSSITDLNLALNYFPEIVQFPAIPSLQHLSMRSCSLRNFEPKAFANLSSLESLDVSMNEINGIYDIIYSLGNLRRLSMYNQAASNFYIKSFSFKNMKSIKTLNLSNLKMGGIVYRYMFYGLRGLSELHLHNTKTHTIMDLSFETLESLEILNLEANLVRQLLKLTFFGLNKLRILSLGSNQIQYISPHTFRCCPKLEVLFLHRNLIQILPGETFYALHNLKNLFLYQNKLEQWSQPQFSSNSSLEVLNLARNSMTGITAIMLEEFVSVTGVLDVSGNPFNCSECGVKKFLDFMNESSLNFSFFSESSKYSEYICASPKKLSGRLLSDITSSDVSCSDGSDWIFSLSIVVLTSTLIGLLVISSVTCYLFRWHVRYWAFRVKAMVKQRQNSAADDPLYVYDAFVCYNSADSGWVVAHLIPALEREEPPLKLCIHERDFEVGVLITENIFDAIAVSKHVILVLSDEFVRSEWCMFELHMAQQKLFDDSRDQIVLIKLKSIDKAYYSRNLLYLEKTRTCHMWTEDPAGQLAFWDKVRKSLGKSKSTSKCDQLTRL